MNIGQEYQATLEASHVELVSVINNLANRFILDEQTALKNNAST